MVVVAKMIRRMVTPELRRDLQRHFPGLDQDPDLAPQRWRLLGELLFSTFLDEQTGGVVLTYQCVAELAGVHPHRHGFAAGRILEDFSQNILPLQVEPYRWIEGHARSVRFALPPQVEESRLRDQRSGPGHPMVDLVTGQPVSEREQGRRTKERRESKRARMLRTREELPEGHPGRRIIDRLLDGQNKAIRIIQKNLPRALSYIEGMPVDTQKQRERRDWCIRVYHAVREAPALCYAGSDSTCRLFAQGENVHQFPRELRRLLFSGCYECDLKATQLAIIAHDWEISRLQAFLEKSLRGGPSIWQMLANETGQSLEQVKPLLKRSVYTAVFGGTKQTVQAGLTQGLDGEPGIGTAAARRLMKHWLFEDLFEAQRGQLKRLEETGGGQDCFGEWHEVSEKRKTRSVLAALVQAREMQIMEAVIKVVERNPQIYLVSWLHDGVTLYLGNCSKKERWRAQLQREAATRAESMGVHTALEVELLGGRPVDLP